MIDLTPATQTLATLIGRIGDDQLSVPTPCSDSCVGDLLDHVDGLALAFALAAAKTPPPGGSAAPAADGSRLGPDWRDRIPARLADLAAAWKDEPAWEGMTEAGGQPLPGEIAGSVALNEVVVHSWDLAVATGQELRVDPELTAAARSFVDAAVSQHPEGTPGLFGPPVPTPADASPLDRLVGLTGRNPDWRATPQGLSASS